MHGLRKLLREIHRRSLWQILGVYLGGSWGVLQAVDFMTGFAGLPDWTPGFAFVLLMIGLPVVTATAFVQQGVPGLRGEYRDEVDPNELVGRTPEEVHVDPAAHPLHGERVHLVAQGVISQGDAVVLATFDDATGEGLGDAITQALRVDLDNAQVLDVVEAVALEGVLARMQVAPGTRLTKRAFWLDRRYPIVNRWRDNS